MAHTTKHQSAVSKLEGHLSKSLVPSAYRKYKRNRARTLRRKKNKLRYFKRLKQVRRDRYYSEKLSETVSVIDITDEMTSDVPYIAPIPDVAEWQNRHQVAYWKSRALAAEYQNQMLLQHLRNAYVKQIDDCAAYLEQNGHTDDTMEGDGTENEAIEESGAVEDPTTKAPNPLFPKYKEDMTTLYGDRSSMIIGMETAVQLNFDYWMNKFRPAYWPSVAINVHKVA